MTAAEAKPTDHTYVEQEIELWKHTAEVYERRCEKIMALVHFATTVNILTALIVMSILMLTLSN